MSQLSWQFAWLITIALCLIFGGVISFIYGLYRADKQHRDSLRKFDARVGRDVFREFTK